MASVGSNTVDQSVASPADPDSPDGRSGIFFVNRDHLTFSQIDRQWDGYTQDTLMAVCAREGGRFSWAGQPRRKLNLIASLDGRSNRVKKH